MMRHANNETGFGARASGKRVLKALLAASAMVVVPLASGAALADAPAAKADVLVIHATDCANPSVDPRIGEAPPLKYKCYALVDKKELALTKGQASTTPLPNGRTFQLTLTDVVDGKRMKLAAAISQPDKGGFMPLANITAEPNKQFYVGGFAHQGGALVLGIRVHP
jgi:hypothetical protein